MCTHVMPPTLRVVVAIWAVGVFRDCPDCFESLWGTLMCEGAIAALGVFGLHKEKLALCPSVGQEGGCFGRS
jgi:hypothetical protein